MFHCVNCKHEGESFHVKIIGRAIEAWLYQAKCPECGSLIVKPFGGALKEENLIITDRDRSKDMLPRKAASPSSVPI